SAFKIRNAGYSMYFKSQPVKQIEIAPNETIFLAIDRCNQPVGTLRVLDERGGNIELEQFLNIDMLLDDSERPCAEATRFTVPFRHPDALIIKLLLWKSYYLFCKVNKVQTALISSRPIYSRNYEYLSFIDLGESGKYYHTHLKNKLHRTYKIDITSIETKWLKLQHPLRNFFFDTNHHISV
ncbi:MAG: hypothetical protein GY874_13525, partial [Desulfobacteraceae bacterium]|nr:hypothetical protein [Desulfobacteraceae bacterium]